MQEGIYFDLPFADYLKAPGLSHSGMKSLRTSPARYWHEFLDPAREPEKPSDAKKLGAAVHAAILEPALFARRYATVPLKGAYPGVLVTNDDLQGWMDARGIRGGRKKEDYVGRINDYCRKAGIAPPVMWSEVLAAFGRDSAGRELLEGWEWERANGASGAVRSDPAALSLLSGGAAEVSVFVTDPESGVLLKCRIDYLTPGAIVDVKSFSNPTGKPTEQAVHDAIRRYRYFQQGVHYSMTFALAREALRRGRYALHGPAGVDLRAMADVILSGGGHGFTFVFVESKPPHEVVIRHLSPAETYYGFGEELREKAIGAFVENRRRFGLEEPWRTPAEPRDLLDPDVPGLRFEMDLPDDFDTSEAPPPEVFA